MQYGFDLRLPRRIPWERILARILICRSICTKGRMELKTKAAADMHALPSKSQSLLLSSVCTPAYIDLSEYLHKGSPLDLGWGAYLGLCVRVYLYTTYMRIHPKTTASNPPTFKLLVLRVYRLKVGFEISKGEHAYRQPPSFSIPCGS